MKSGYGFVLAVILGLIGLAFNYLYLSSKAGQVEMVAFIGIAPDAEVPQGARLKESDLVRVNIPKLWVGNLEKYAFRDTAWASVIGERVVRDKQGGSLLLLDDIQAPPPELKLGPREGVTWIPVDTKSFVPSLVNPGDRISFLVSRGSFALPTPAGGAGADQASQPAPAPGSAGEGPIEVLGPFTVVSVGNRLGRADVFRAARMPRSQENVIGIRVVLDSAGNPPPDVRKLRQLLEMTNYRPMGVILHGREKQR